MTAFHLTATCALLASLALAAPEIPPFSLDDDAVPRKYSIDLTIDAVESTAAIADYQVTDENIVITFKQPVAAVSDTTVVAEAVKQNMGVIAMKVCAQRRVLTRLSMAEALGYVWSIPGVSLAIVGCDRCAKLRKPGPVCRATAGAGSR